MHHAPHPDAARAHGRPRAPRTGRARRRDPRPRRAAHPRRTPALRHERHRSPASPCPSPARRPTRWTSPRRRASSSASTAVGRSRSCTSTTTSFVTSVVPVGPFPIVTSFGEEFLAEVEALSPDGTPRALLAQAPSRCREHRMCGSRTSHAHRAAAHGAGWSRDPRPAARRLPRARAHRARLLARTPSRRTAPISST